MFTIDMAIAMAEVIAEMKDGEVSSIARVAHNLFGDGYEKVLPGDKDGFGYGGMFLLMDLTLYECAKQGVYLDYSTHNGKKEGLPFNLTFVKQTSDQIGTPANDVSICILHHPLRDCTQWSEMKLEDYALERAIVAFNGNLKKAKSRYWENDNGSGFTIDCKKVGNDCYVTVLIDGAYKKPFEALLSGFGEPITYSLPLCDAMEEWTFILYKDSLDLDEVMEGFRKVSDSEYISIHDEEERDEFFSRFHSS